MKPANNAETAAATHAKEDARCREEGGRKRERESGGVYVVYAALRGLRYSLKALPLSLSLSPLRSGYRDASRINFSIRFLDGRRRRGGGKRTLFKFKNGRKLPGISLHV